MSVTYQVQERGEVIFLMKDVAAAFAPVQEMLNKPTS